MIYPMICDQQGISTTVSAPFSRVVYEVILCPADKAFDVPFIYLQYVFL